MIDDLHERIGDNIRGGVINAYKDPGVDKSGEYLVNVCSERG